jgi:MoaA/NifB/PqqE/SkfB family radical SAM enzyme
MQLQRQVGHHPSAATQNLLRGERVVARRLPEVVNLELTNNCNLMCAKCPTYDARRGRGFMSRQLFTKVIHDIEEGADPVMSVGLSGGGEPVLHPEVHEFIAIAKKVPNIRGIHMATNGLGLTPDKSEVLLKAGLTSLKISLDTNDPAVYRKVNRVDGYEQAAENIRSFFRIRKAGGFQCRAEMKVTLYKNDEKFKQAMRDLWSPVADSVRFTGLHNWLGLRGAAVQTRTMPCAIPWNEVQILWNGQITLCCFDAMEGFIDMGNVADIHLVDYWQKDRKLTSVRQSMTTLDFSEHPVCGKCTIYEYKRDI